MTTVSTLQNLCLDKIISEFGWYYQVYSSTEDSSLKLNFEFLKKKFSYRIVKKLNEDHYLETKYLDFLINKYLKVLDTRWLKEWPWETVTQKLAEIGPNLEEIIFSDRPWEKILCCLPNLKTVFYQHHCSDEFLVYLSKFCGCIEILDVTESSGVSESGLQNLCCIPGKNSLSFHLSIKELFIEYTAVGDEGVAYILKNMPNLQKIDYWGLPEVLYSMHKSDINALDKVKPYNLTHLTFRDTSPYSYKYFFNDMLTVCLIFCPHLKSLTCPILRKQHLDLCSHLKKLEKLQLDCCKQSYLDLNELLMLNGKKLTLLNINNFCMTLSVLASNCPHLNVLQMRRINLHHNINDSVPVFHNLEEVVFEKFIFIEPDIIFQAVTCLLSSAPNLNQLRFKSCGIFSSDIKIQILRCCEQCKLTIIDFSCSDVEFAFLRDILITCSTLETLTLDGCGIILQYGAMGELQAIATSLPNKPQVVALEEHVIHLSSSSDSDQYKFIDYTDEEIMMNDDTDEEIMMNDDTDEDMMNDDTDEENSDDDVSNSDDDVLDSDDGEVGVLG